MEIPTKQEMFNRAYLGLKSQGFRQARCERTGACEYYMLDGDQVLRCAWGWVDPEGTTRADVLDDGKVRGRTGDIWTLTASSESSPGRGLAYTLYSLEDAELGSALLNFGRELQVAHDGRSWAMTPEEIERRILDVAAAHNLTIPTGEG